MKRAPLVVVLSLGILLSRTALAEVTEGGAEVGFAQRWLYRVPIELGTVSASFAIRTPSLSFSFPFGIEWGKTLEGLSVFQGRAGFLLEGVVGRLRLGFGTGVGGIAIARVTTSESFNAVFLDVVGRVSVDLARFGAPRPLARSRSFPALPAEGEVPIDGEDATARSAFFVATEFRANTAQVWGPSISLGARY